LRYTAKLIDTTGRAVLDDSSAGGDAVDKSLDK
jgi:hypothetical protein